MCAVFVDSNDAFEGKSSDWKNKKRKIELSEKVMKNTSNPICTEPRQLFYPFKSLQRYNLAFSYHVMRLYSSNKFSRFRISANFVYGRKLYKQI